MDEEYLLPEETVEYWEKKYNKLCRQVLIGTFITTCIALSVGEYMGKEKAKKDFIQNPIKTENDQNTKLVRNNAAPFFK